MGMQSKAEARIVLAQIGQENNPSDRSEKNTLRATKKQ
jgi:hypothetical protein